MHDFAFERPATREAALAAFASGGEAAYLAGGHTLLPAMKARLRAPERLIDLAHVPGLTDLGLVEDRLWIGAMVNHAAVAADRVIGHLIPGLAALAKQIGDPQVRNRGTIGGVLANNDPAADYPAACLALDAHIETDRATHQADNYFQGMFATALAEGELIVRVGFRVPLASAYAKFRHPASRYALAGVYVARLPDNDVRVAVTGAAAGAFRWAEAEAALTTRFDATAVADLTLPADDLNADIHASAEYRAQLCAVMLRQAVGDVAAVVLPA